MIVRLPSLRGRPRVTRTDWMISLSLRSMIRSGSLTSSGSSRRWRTSCWVIVDAPRSSPRSVSRAAAAMPIGSTPVFVQKVPSSIAVGAGEDRDLLEGDRLAPLAGVEACQLDLAGTVVDDRFGDELELLELARGGSPWLYTANTPTVANSPKKPMIDIGRATWETDGKRSAHPTAAPGSFVGVAGACEPSRLACICARL